MNYKNILITGGAGFVGSNLSIKLKQEYSTCEIIALDNLMRRGSELNVSRLKDNNVKFIHGDVRNKEDLQFEDIDLIIECSAEPSVMAGINTSPEYLLNTNLIGAINCFELARKTKADVIFLSTSRIYPIKKINDLNFIEEKTRFSLSDSQNIEGASINGISEQFPINDVRSLYGTTKLSAELILQEYIENYGIKGVVNRCGLITGPWQMGKVDQGIITFWIAGHIFNKPLSYIGFEGKGKQVRDAIYIDDLFDILSLQIQDIEKFNGNTYNIGGGKTNSVSLLELTNYCQEISKNKLEISQITETRPGDIRIYITDNSNISKLTGWSPRIGISQGLEEIYKWITENKSLLSYVLS